MQPNEQQQQQHKEDELDTSVSISTGEKNKDDNTTIPELISSSTPPSKTTNPPDVTPLRNAQKCDEQTHQKCLEIENLLSEDHSMGMIPDYILELKPEAGKREVAGDADMRTIPLQQPNDDNTMTVVLYVKTMPPRYCKVVGVELCPVKRCDIHNEETKRFCGVPFRIRMKREHGHEFELHIYGDALFASCGMTIKTIFSRLAPCVDTEDWSRLEKFRGSDKQHVVQCKHETKSDTASSSMGEEARSIPVTILACVMRSHPRMYRRYIVATEAIPDDVHEHSTTFARRAARVAVCSCYGTEGFGIVYDTLSSVLMHEEKVVKRLCDVTPDNEKVKLEKDVDACISKYAELSDNTSVEYSTHETKTCVIACAHVQGKPLFEDELHDVLLVLDSATKPRSTVVGVDNVCV